MMIWVHWKLVRLTSFRVCCLQIVIVHFYVADSRSDPLLWLQSSLSFALNEGIMSSFSATLLWQKSEIKNKDILHTYQTTAWTFMAFDYHKNGYNQLVHFHIVGKIYLIWMSKTKLIFVLLVSLIFQIFEFLQRKMNKVPQINSTL